MSGVDNEASKRVKPTTPLQSTPQRTVPTSPAAAAANQDAKDTRKTAGPAAAEPSESQAEEGPVKDTGPAEKFTVLHTTDEAEDSKRVHLSPVVQFVDKPNAQGAGQEEEG